MNYNKQKWKMAKLRAERVKQIDRIIENTVFAVSVVMVLAIIAFLVDFSINR